MTLTGGVVIGLGGDGADGRDGTTPGRPSDESTPFDDSDEGRQPAGPSKSPNDAQRLTEAAEAPAPSEASTPADNGRGGVDPANGPLAPVPGAGSGTDDATLAPGQFDTDSGEAPSAIGSAGQSSKQQSTASSGRTEYVDQDVPGAPTGGPDGPDDPPNDADG